VEILRDAKEEFITIQCHTRYGETMIFPRAQMVAATDEILTDNGVRSQGSADHAGDLEHQTFQIGRPTAAGGRDRPVFMFKKPIQRIQLLTAILAAGCRQLEAQTPEIVPLGEPQLWQRAEFRVDHAPVATNCFDPDLIRLDATFTPPSGRALTVPAFWYQDYSRMVTNGAEVVSPVGSPQWRIRFTPAEPGDYKLSLNIETNGVSRRQADNDSFQTCPLPRRPDSTAMCAVAPDKRYFETTDGRPLRLVGENVCWPEHQVKSDYDAWFGAMRNAGENFARLWMAPWFAGLEHTPGTLNRYTWRRPGSLTTFSIWPGRTAST